MALFVCLLEWIPERMKVEQPRSERHSGIVMAVPRIRNRR